MKPVTIHALDTTQGAAWRTQLDAMLNVLTTGGPDSIDQAAAEAQDLPVMRLIARLHEARAAAITIETRPQPHTTPRTPARGVSFRRT
jgi:hypothetical protein